MKNTPFVLIALFFLFSCKKDKKAPVPPPPYVPKTTTFTIPADSVILNPTGNAPLAALVHFTSTITGHAEMTVVGMHGPQSDISQVFNDNSPHHSIPVLGLYANYTNTVEIEVIDSKKDTAKSTISIITAPISHNVPNYIHVDVADLPNMESGVNLVSSLTNYPSPPELPYMVDSFGDIRWCLDFTNNAQLKNLFYDCGINRLHDGNYRFVDQYTEKIYEVDIMGKIINTWSMGGFIFNHDLYEKPNGNFLVTCNDPNSASVSGYATSEDNIIEIDRTSGQIINRWDLKKSMDQYRHVLYPDRNDWIHDNGVVYDPSDNTIVVSGRLQAVVKLTNDNHVKWILAPHRGWGKNGYGEDLNQFLLTPLDSVGHKITDTSVVNGWTNASSFEWCWYQHSPQLMPNGDLLVFDNGQVRNYIISYDTAAHYSRAVEYRINEANMTVQQIWEYGKERGDQTFAQIASSVGYYPDKNHVLFCPGFEVINTKGFGGKIVEVDYATKAVVFQLSISSANHWGFHRVQRMDIYPNANPYYY